MKYLIVLLFLVGCKPETEIKIPDLPEEKIESEESNLIELTRRVEDLEFQAGGYPTRQRHLSIGDSIDIHVYQRAYLGDNSGRILYIKENTMFIAKDACIWDVKVFPYYPNKKLVYYEEEIDTEYTIIWHGE